MVLLCYLRAGACASGVSSGWDVSGGLLGAVPSTRHGYKCAGQDRRLEWLGWAVQWGWDIPYHGVKHSLCGFLGRRTQGLCLGEGGIC